MPRGKKQGSSVFEVPYKSGSVYAFYGSKYLFSKRKKIYSSTFEEATINRAVHDVLVDLVKAVEATAPLEQRRRKQKEIHGKNQKEEYHWSTKIAAEWTAQTGLPSTVMNDGTKADIAFHLDQTDDTCIAIQVKTAIESKINHNIWEFKEIKKYEGMMVVCIRRDKQDGWVFDGKVLIDIPTNTLSIGPLNKYGDYALSAVDAIDIKSLVSCLIHNSSMYPTHSLETMRWNLGSYELFMEMIGIRSYEHATKQVGFFPNSVGGRTDYIIGGRHKQFKSARSTRSLGRAGVSCEMHRRNGSDNGKVTYTLYNEGDFDEAIIAYVDGKRGLVHFWEIPANVLVSKRKMHVQGTPDDNSSIVTHFTETERKQYELGPRAKSWTKYVWTLKYYMGVFELPKFSEEIRSIVAEYFERMELGIDSEEDVDEWDKYDFFPDGDDEEDEEEWELRDFFEDDESSDDEPVVMASPNISRAPSPFQREGEISPSPLLFPLSRSYFPPANGRKKKKAKVMGIERAMTQMSLAEFLKH
jgi:hypothetical protein